MNIQCSQGVQNNFTPFDNGDTYDTVWNIWEKCLFELQAYQHLIRITPIYIFFIHKYKYYNIAIITTFIPYKRLGVDIVETPITLQALKQFE